MASKIWLNDASGEYETNQRARQAWFKKIAPVGNWKTEIDCWIEPADLIDCNEAAIFFTGSSLEVHGKVRRDGKIHVTAPGYYATIGA